MTSSITNSLPRLHIPADVTNPFSYSENIDGNVISSSPSSITSSDVEIEIPNIRTTPSLPPSSPYDFSLTPSSLPCTPDSSQTPNLAEIVLDRIYERNFAPTPDIVQSLENAIRSSNIPHQQV